MSLTVGEWIFIVIVSLMLLFAVVSNMLVVYCVIRFKKLRTVTNLFIGNLAISDIILAGFLMPQKLHDISHSEDFFEGEVLCRLVNFCPILAMTSSIYTLVAISFERRRAIINIHSTQVSMATMAKLLPGIWLFGMLVSLPTFLEYSVTLVSLAENSTSNVTRTYLSCGNHDVNAQLTLVGGVFLLFVSYVIPVIIMFKNYIQVALFVWNKGRQIKANPDPSNAHNRANYHILKNRIKIVKMLVLVAVIFAISWLPFYIALLYAKVTGESSSEDSSGFLNLFLILMATFSTAYNVILYVIFNPSFRVAIVKILQCKTSDEPLHPMVTMVANGTNTRASHC